MRPDQFRLSAGTLRHQHWQAHLIAERRTVSPPTFSSSPPAIVYLLSTALASETTRRTLPAIIEIHLTKRHLRRELQSGVGKFQINCAAEVDFSWKKIFVHRFLYSGRLGVNTSRNLNTPKILNQYVRILRLGRHGRHVQKASNCYSTLWISVQIYVNFARFVSSVAADTLHSYVVKYFCLYNRYHWCGPWYFLGWLGISFLWHMHAKLIKIFNGIGIQKLIILQIRIFLIYFVTFVYLMR